MKRIILFLVTNLVAVFALTVVTHVILALCGTSLAELFGEQWTPLLVYAFVYGLGGSFISLLMSKPMAKFSTKAKTIDGSEGPAERWLVDTIADLARQANLKMPEVAIYPGAANAFATGAFRNSALVAVSTDIMGQMSKDELRAVLGHEMSHVANGDMVTLCLVQGVLNAFVLLFSRILASVISSALSGDRKRRSSGAGTLVIAQVLQLVLGAFASLVAFWFSRKREFAADAGSAKLLGSPFPMIAALRRLDNLQPGVLPDSIKAFGISSGKPKSKTSPWSTHPSIEDRISALQNLTFTA